MKNGVVRNYVTPVNPATADQMMTRSFFTTLSQRWGSVLTEAQRAAWEAAAQSGDWMVQDGFTGTPRNPKSGMDLFIRLGMNLWMAADKTAAYLNDAPAKQASGTSMTTGLSAAAALGTISLTYSGAIDTNELQLIFAAAPVSPGRLKVRMSELRFILVTGGGSPIDIAAAYTSRYGAITAKEGQAIFVYVYAVNEISGQRRVVGMERAVIAA